MASLYSIWRNARSNDFVNFFLNTDDNLTNSNSLSKNKYTLTQDKITSHEN